MGLSNTSFVRALVTAGGVLMAALAASAQPAPEFRGFWVDTFNTRLNTPEDVDTVVTRAQQARANLLLVQVRRRGDAWYLDSIEPPPDGVALAQDFDPLAEVIARGHAAGLQIHAYVVVADIWNQTTLPTSPAHVFNQHGLTPVGVTQPGRANWLTRTLLPDGAFTSYGGHRFGSDFWIDPGHPDAAAHVVSVVTKLVSSYDLDGLHLDRLQYPDFGPAATAPGTQSVTPFANVGYNDTSLERYRRRYALPADAMPGAADPTWVEWRRDQVTALMRRLYLSALAIKPRLVVSASAHANGEPPDRDDGWTTAEPVARVFQDWRAWLEEGVVDVVVPMVYRPEHVAAGAESFGRWLAWTDAHRYGRATALGLGAYLNSVEGTLRQARRALTKPAGAAVAATPAPRGVVIFSMGAHNAPVNANPLALTPRDTPYRAFEDLASALTTGRTSTGQPLELPAFAPVFAEAITAPTLSWKTSPTTGSVMGVVSYANGSPADGAAVALESMDVTPDTNAAAATDGGGFYGRVGLSPGEYRLVVTPSGEGPRRSTCTVTVVAGAVATLNVRIDAASPALASCQ